MTTAARPEALPLLESGVPEWMQQLPQWVVWRYQQRGGKWTKVPFTARGGRASSTDPKTWSTWEVALAAYRAGGYDGVGFVFASGRELTGFDLDDCRDAITGVVEPWGLALLALLP